MSPLCSNKCKAEQTKQLRTLLGSIERKDMGGNLCCQEWWDRGKYRDHGSPEQILMSKTTMGTNDRQENLNCINKLLEDQCGQVSESKTPRSQWQWRHHNIVRLSSRSSIGFHSRPVPPGIHGKKIDKHSWSSQPRSISSLKDRPNHRMIEHFSPPTSHHPVTECLF